MRCPQGHRRDDGAPSALLTDEAALTGILRNLLSNGIKYTEKGEVRLSVSEAGDRIEMSVSDTGPGIPPAQQERVFEEFYRMPGTRTRGTGLGLPYARHLAGLLGGELTLTGIAGRVVEAADGEQALIAIGDGSADLLLTDLRMPGLDGTTLLERLPDSVPAIVVTGMDVPAPPR